jgi:hypothetical protein
MKTFFKWIGRFLILVGQKAEKSGRFVPYCFVLYTFIPIYQLVGDLLDYGEHFGWERGMSPIFQILLVLRVGSIIAIFFCAWLIQALGSKPNNASA